jgi:glycerol-3-phosphate dehydrogenase
MKITIQVLIESADVLPLAVPIHIIDRPCERIEEVELQTAEAKSILKGLEQNLVRQQRIAGCQEIVPARPAITSNQGLPSAAIPERLR